MNERRQPFVVDEAKFSTQRVVTYVLLLLFCSVTVAVFRGDDQAERSMMLQTVVNFTLIAVSFWLGMSKGAADQAASSARIAEAGPKVTPGPVTPAGVTPAAEVVKP